MSPTVSVLMSVYNGERFLREAVVSILGQTFTDFEFLIIDDGSTDTSRDIILSCNDQRISLIKNKKNAGLANSLNRGLQAARGKYIARMDSDDISMPERLAKQVAFMEAHPEIGICGSWVETIGAPTGDVWRYPTDSVAIRCTLLFENALAHSAVMMRRQFITENNIFYDAAYRRSQDYELWVRASEYAPLANIGEILLRHRLHPRGIGSQYPDEQLAFAGEIRLTQLRKLGISLTREEFDLHQSISLWKFDADRKFVHSVGMWLNKIKDANERTHVYPEPAFSRVLGGRWLAACSAAGDLGMWVVKKYWRSSLSGPNLTRKQKLVSALKSIARRKVLCG